MVEVTTELPAAQPTLGQVIRGAIGHAISSYFLPLTLALRIIRQVYQGVITLFVPVRTYENSREWLLLHHDLLEVDERIQELRREQRHLQEWVEHQTTLLARTVEEIQRRTQEERQTLTHVQAQVREQQQVLVHVQAQTVQMRLELVQMQTQVQVQGRIEQVADWSFSQKWPQSLDMQLDPEDDIRVFVSHRSPLSLQQIRPLFLLLGSSGSGKSTLRIEAKRSHSLGHYRSMPLRRAQTGWRYWHRQGHPSEFDVTQQQAKLFHWLAHLRPEGSREEREWTQELLEWIRKQLQMLEKVEK